MNIWWWWIVAVLVLGISFFVMLKNAPDRKGVNVAIAPRRVPERRFAYGREDMEAFIGDADPAVLQQYSGTVLKWDAVFAVLFALGMALVATASFLTWFDPQHWWLKWPVLVICSWVGCMSLLYGAADVAEDYLLRRIIDQSRPQRLAGKKGEGLGVDMAQVDAANVLTRVKIITLGGSIAGAGLWFVMSVVADRLRRPRRPKGDAPSSELVAG